MRQLLWVLGDAANGGSAFIVKVKAGQQGMTFNPRRSRTYGCVGRPYQCVSCCGCWETLRMEVVSS
jgi:hypothetical protein